MKSLVLYTPDEVEWEKFDIGILIPAYKEWAAPFVCLSKWLDAITVIEKRFRVLILILVNWPSRNILLNQVTKEFSRELKAVVQYGSDFTASHEEDINRLFDELQFYIYRNGERVKIILWESYSTKNTIWMARHKWCNYLKKYLLPSWIIVSTDSDTWPAERGYLQAAINKFEDNPDIWWMTGDFTCIIESNASDRTHDLHNYEMICSLFYSGLVASAYKKDSWDPLDDLALMPGSNSIFRAGLYDNKIRFSEHLWTWEDMDFSRKLLEAGHQVLYDPSVRVKTLYRPSDRTEYGLGTEISKVNQSWDFQVLHPLVKIWKHKASQIFEHVWNIEWMNIQESLMYLVWCLKAEFWEDIIDTEVVEKLTLEIMSGKWYLVGRPYLNDNAIRIIYDRISMYYWRIDIASAYELIIQYIQERLAQMNHTIHGNLLISIFLEELVKMRKYDRDNWNYEVFLRNILEKIEAILSSIDTSSYKDRPFRLEPIPSPWMHLIA